MEKVLVFELLFGALVQSIEFIANLYPGFLDLVPHWEVVFLDVFQKTIVCLTEHTWVNPLVLCHSIQKTGNIKKEKKKKNKKKKNTGNK